MSGNLANTLSETAERHGDQTAFKLDDFELSYHMLDCAASRIANLLEDKGLQPGDRVGLMLPNLPYFPSIYYGILRAGGVVVPMNVLLKGREVGFYLGDSGAKLLFAWADFAEAAEEGAGDAAAEVIVVKPGEFEQLVGAYSDEYETVERAADDTAVILYTSGTTGKPKGAELCHDNLGRNCGVTHSSLGGFGPDDVLLGALPLFHSFGQTCTMNSAVATGACVTMLPRFDPEKALEIIERDRVTVFQGVPTMYNAMLHANRADSTDASTLRLCMSGGAAIPVELIRAFEEKFGCAILEGYGRS
jgi:long-chain acyl-CoA synthetase